MSVDDEVWESQAMANLSYCDDAFLESRHGWTHVWIGGYVTPLHQSPNDPAFFLLHAYVDYMWETWRQRRQSGDQRQTEYGRVFVRRPLARHTRAEQRLVHARGHAGARAPRADEAVRAEEEH